jgi:putative spermidine/putrescine transport system substrate-binding protein
MQRVLTLTLVVLLASAPVYAGGGQEAGAEAEAGAREAPFAERVSSMSWEEIVAEADGQEVFFYMWGGSDAINQFVQGYIGERVEENFGITLEMVPVTDASVFVNKVLGEKQAGRTEDGSVDLMWINGENFRAMKEADLLFGPYADMLPNMDYVDTSNPVIEFDFGYPVEGYESPYGGAQFVMVYDSARFADPPRSLSELFAWARENPGRFTYPAPPDFNGSAFVRHVFYHAAGGYEQFQGPFDQELFDQVASRAWEMLNEIEPFLWREGETYPETRTQLQGMFANGEVDFDMDYNPRYAANLILQGRYPQSARTFVFEDGTLTNTHYVAIPFNSSHKAAAMVVANVILEPATQLEKTKPEVWGDPTVLSIDKLPEEWQRRFENLPRSEAVLEPEVLQEHRVPEPQAGWIEAIEEGWRANVLQK